MLFLMTKATGGFDVRDACGQAFQKEKAADPMMKEGYDRAVGRAGKAAFRARWLEKKYAECE